MNEEERKKIAYLRAMGKENKAMNLERKIEQREIKKQYKLDKQPVVKEEVKEDKKPSLLKRLANKGKEVLNNVKDDVTDKVKEVKKIIKKKPPVEKPEVEKPEVEKEVKPIVKNISKKRTVTGGIGQAYENGVGNVKVNGVPIKPGEEGYEAAVEELLAMNKKQKLREIELKKLAEKNK